MFTLFDNYNRDPGMVMTVPNRQYNTESIRERGGSHIFYGLAEIKINDNKDINQEQLNDQFIENKESAQNPSKDKV